MKKPQTQAYRAWSMMIQRCTNPKRRHFDKYGGRGITVCDRWMMSSANFLADMGPKPTPKHQLDRIDNDGNYEPGNCRWATKVEQMRNRRVTHWIEHDGARRCLAEWSEITGIHHMTILKRLRLGWETGRALTQPLRGVAEGKRLSRVRWVQ